MSSSAYILINYLENHKENLVKSLKRIKELIEITETYGTYNFVIKIESNNEDTLQDIIIWKIKILHSVKTLVVLKNNNN